MRKKEPNIKIFVAHHKPWYIYEDDIIIPIHAGKENSKLDLCILQDNIWDNISNKNNEYSELTAQYRVWKNYDLSDVDYVWFWHYRRYMTYYKQSFINVIQNIFNIDKRFWIMWKVAEIKEGLIYKNFSEKTLKDNTNDLKKYISDNNYDIYLPKREICIKRKILSLIWIKYNLYENYNDERYRWSKNDKLNTASRKIFIEKYPEYWDAYANLREDEREKLYSWNHRNMFIMKKELFYKYMERLFDYLFDIEEYISKNKIDTSLDRDRGFLWMFSEKLINYFVAYERDRWKNVSFESNILFFK